MDPNRLPLALSAHMGQEVVLLKGKRVRKLFTIREPTWHPLGEGSLWTVHLFITETLNDTLTPEGQFTATNEALF